MMELNLQLPHLETSNDLSRKFSLVRAYLEDTNISAEHTAKELTISAEDTSAPELNESRSGVEEFLWNLWAMVVESIQQIPHNHPWQDRMVNLLSEIKKVPRQVTPEMEELERSWGMAYWQDLPIFGAEVRETWDRGPWEKIQEGIFMHPGDTPFSPDVWNNLNAFTARLTAASVMNFETYATWILGHTLEEERLDEEIDDNLPAAAMWIIHAGRMVYHNTAKEYRRSAETHFSDIQYLRKFSKPFSKERWDFWKERFAFLQDQENLKQRTRDSAREALDKMAEIERCEPEPKAEMGSFLYASGVMTAVTVRGMSGDE